MGFLPNPWGINHNIAKFLDVINNFDFVILCETWTRSNVVEVRRFRSVTQDATQSRKGGRDSGGIVLLYKNTFHEWISIVKKSCNFLWFKIEKDYAKTVKDIYRCRLYIPPCNSPYFNVELYLLTQGSKTFAMRYDKMNAMVNTLVH